MNRTSSIFVFSVAALALLACGDDGAGSSGNGGSGDGGNGPAGSGGNNASGSTMASSSASPESGMSSSSSKTSAGSGVVPECQLSDFMEGFFTDPAANECVQEVCCDELAACDPDVDPTACFNQGDGSFDPSLPTAGALDDCIYHAGCFGGGPDCHVELEFGEDLDPDFVDCVGENCCEEFNYCTSGYEDPQACLDCLNGDLDDYDLCEPANECAISNCEQGIVFVPICDSGIGTYDIEAGQCSDASCCDAYTACTGGDPEDEAAIQDCLDCLDEGAGELCDAVIACEDENCSTAVCDSGIAFSDIETARCLTESCCAEYTACAGPDPEDEEAIQECIDCFIAEGGELCDAAIECTDTFCGQNAGGGGSGSGGAAGNGG